MRRPRFIIDVTATTALGLLSVQAQVDAHVALRNVTARHRDWVGTGLRRLLEIELATVAELDLMWTWTLANAATLGTEASGSASRHMCSHWDPAVVSCKEAPESEYQEVAI